MASQVNNDVAEAIAQRPTAPAVDLDSIFNSYTKIKEIGQRQQKLDEERKYHENFLNLNAKMGGYVPQVDPKTGKTMYVQDPTQIAVKQAAAREQTVKTAQEAQKAIPLSMLFTDPIKYFTMKQALAQQAYASTTGSAAPDTSAQGSPLTSGLSGVGNAMSSPVSAAATPPVVPKRNIRFVS